MKVSGPQRTNCGYQQATQTKQTTQSRSRSGEASVGLGRRRRSNVTFQSNLDKTQQKRTFNPDPLPLELDFQQHVFEFDTWLPSVAVNTSKKAEPTGSELPMRPKRPLLERNVEKTDYHELNSFGFAGEESFVTKVEIPSDDLRENDDLRFDLQNSMYTKLEQIEPKYNKTAKDKNWWTAAEDEKLRAAVVSCKGKNWKLISETAAVGKNDVQCLQRWSQVLRPGLKKGSWSKEEDERLVRLVHEEKCVSSEKKEVIPWKKIERVMGGRTAKQCRERWKLSLDPSINKSSWTREEDQRLTELQQRFGNSWSKIKVMLGTNRTENAVKLRFKCLKKREEKHQRNLMYERSKKQLGETSMLSIRSAPELLSSFPSHISSSNLVSSSSFSHQIKRDEEEIQPRVKRTKTELFPIELFPSNPSSFHIRRRDSSTNVESWDDIMNVLSE